MTEPPEWVMERWRSLPRQRLTADDPGDDPISSRLAYALSNGLSLDVLYAEPGNLARRVVRPQQLERVLNGSVGRLYIIAFDETTAENRHFRLDRIRDARIPRGASRLERACRRHRRNQTGVSADSGHRTSKPRTNAGSLNGTIGSRIDG